MNSTTSHNHINDYIEKGLCYRSPTVDAIISNGPYINLQDNNNISEIIAPYYGLNDTDAPEYIIVSVKLDDVFKNTDYEPIRPGICGDIVVGFYAKEDVSFSIKFSNPSIIKEIRIKKGEFYYAINNRDVYPVLMLPFHPLYIKCENKKSVSIICAYLRDDKRRSLINNMNYIAYIAGNEYIITHGMIGPIPKVIQDSSS